MKTYIIGDVHGCKDELHELLFMIYEDAGTDTCRIVFVGDLIDKGPSSLDCIEEVHALATCGSKKTDEVIMVLGNHEDKYMRWLAHEYRRKNFPDYKNPIIRKPEWIDRLQYWAQEEGGFNWLKTCPLFYKVPDTDFIVIHAGIEPCKKSLPTESWEFAPKKDKSLFFTRWISEATGRFLTLGTEDEKVDKWWASVYDGRFGTAIYGHQAFREVKVHEHAIGIDTGCCYGNKLTAIRLPDLKLIQVQAKKAYCEPFSSEGLK